MRLQELTAIQYDEMGDTWIAKDRAQLKEGLHVKKL